MIFTRFTKQKTAFLSYATWTKCTGWSSTECHTFTRTATGGPITQQNFTGMVLPIHATAQAITRKGGYPGKGEGSWRPRIQWRQIVCHGFCPWTRSWLCQPGCCSISGTNGTLGTWAKNRHCTWEKNIFLKQTEDFFRALNFNIFLKQTEDLPLEKRTFRTESLFQKDVKLQSSETSFLIFLKQTEDSAQEKITELPELWIFISFSNKQKFQSFEFSHLSQTNRGFRALNFHIFLKQSEDSALEKRTEVPELWILTTHQLHGVTSGRKLQRCRACLIIIRNSYKVLFFNPSWTHCAVQTSYHKKHINIHFSKQNLNYHYHLSNNTHAHTMTCAHQSPLIQQLTKYFKQHQFESDFSPTQPVLPSLA